MVERHLAKVDVAGSNPVSRFFFLPHRPIFGHFSFSKNLKILKLPSFSLGLSLAQVLTHVFFQNKEIDDSNL